MKNLTAKTRRIAAIVTFAAVVAPFAAQAPALADGAASTRNILLGAAAATALIVTNINRHNANQNQNGPLYQGRAETVNGTVSSYGGYNMGLDSNNGSMSVALHQGTIINPTGTTLQPGMPVQVSGYWQNDGSFAANEIDVAQNNYYNNGGYNGGNYNNGGYNGGYYNNGRRYGR